MCVGSCCGKPLNLLNEKVLPGIDAGSGSQAVDAQKAFQAHVVQRGDAVRVIASFYLVLLQVAGDHRFGGFANARGCGTK